MFDKIDSVDKIGGYSIYCDLKYSLNKGSNENEL